jgi:phage/plasmid primase-like uncharacterized protein
MLDRIKTTDVAQGRWTEILLAIGVPGHALKTGRNGPCLFCGGRDRARYTNYQNAGWYVCSQCGNRSGIQFVMKFLGVDFRSAANKVDQILRGDALISMDPANRPSCYDTRIPKATRQCAMWLQKNRPQDLEDFLDRHTAELRWWLATQASWE